MGCSCDVWGWVGVCCLVLAFYPVWFLVVECLSSISWFSLCDPLGSAILWSWRGSLVLRGGLKEKVKQIGEGSGFLNVPGTGRKICVNGNRGGFFVIREKDAAKLWHSHRHSIRVDGRGIHFLNAGPHIGNFRHLRMILCFLRHCLLLTFISNSILS